MITNIDKVAGTCDVVEPTTIGEKVGSAIQAFSLPATSGFTATECYWAMMVWGGVGFVLGAKFGPRISGLTSMLR